MGGQGAGEGVFPHGIGILLQEAVHGAGRFGAVQMQDGLREKNSFKFLDFWIKSLEFLNLLESLASCHFPGKKRGKSRLKMSQFGS